MADSSWVQIRVWEGNKKSIEAIGDEWRMNVQQTIAALVEHWNRSTDELRIEAIRRPPTKAHRQAVPA